MVRLVDRLPPPSLYGGCLCCVARSRLFVCVCARAQRPRPERRCAATTTAARRTASPSAPASTEVRVFDAPLCSISLSPPLSCSPLFLTLSSFDFFLSPYLLSPTPSQSPHLLSLSFSFRSLVPSLAPVTLNVTSSKPD